MLSVVGGGNGGSEFCGIDLLLASMIGVIGVGCRTNHNICGELAARANTGELHLRDRCTWYAPKMALLLLLLLSSSSSSQRFEDLESGRGEKLEPTSKKKRVAPKTSNLKGESTFWEKVRR